MWNFTVRGAIIPDISEIEELMTCKETATMPQTDISQVEAEDLFLDSMPEHKKLWDDWLDGYYLELLDGSLNGIPKPPKPFLEMSELLLEDNSTLTGTAAILEQFGKEFSIPCPDHYEIPFNKLEKKYDLKSARLQYEFMRSVDVHNTEMQEMEKQLRLYEKQIDASTYDVNDTESDTDSGDDDGTRSSGSVTKKTVQQPKDARFKALYERISIMAQDSSH
ncbi:Hypothetical predicted protein [Paramuricea clavata]|uniref:Uncharacterized protein n=1 Tax=Paramuricea clavata TaxID=317549 RepID=A0A7D9L9F4_PARCT|nr:Hypothetical predicted protein [Paramuricea clavata]